MLRFLRRGQRWVTALFVVGVGGVFVFFLGLGGPLSGPTGGAIVQVGDYRFGLREFERIRSMREEEIRQSAGDDYDPRALSDALNEITARVLVDRAVLALEADRLGLSVSNREIEHLVLAAPGFRDASGRFDRELYRDRIEYEWGNEANFIEEQRISMLAGKMLRLLHDLPQVSEGEVREAVERRLEEIRVAWVELDASEPPEGFSVSEEEVQAFLAEREPEARALYEERAAIYDAPEQARARHILIRVPPDAEEEEVAELEAKAQELLERVQAGEDFAELAREHSQDPGSKDNGGDLGWFPRGRMVKAFEDAAFGQEIGKTERIRSDFGFHVIRVEERKEANKRSFEEVREELAREILTTEAGMEVSRALAEELAAAVREGTPLEAAARERELTLERSGWLRRRPDGFVPGLGPAQDLMAAAFALEPGGSSPEIFTLGEKLVMVQTLERKEPAPEAVAAQIETERKRLLEGKRVARSEAWVSARRQQLLEAGQLSVDLEAVR